MFEFCRIVKKWVVAVVIWAQLQLPLAYATQQTLWLDIDRDAQTQLTHLKIHQSLTASDFDVTSKALLADHALTFDPQNPFVHALRDNFLFEGQVTSESCTISLGQNLDTRVDLVIYQDGRVVVNALRGTQNDYELKTFGPLITALNPDLSTSVHSLNLIGSQITNQRQLGVSHNLKTIALDQESIITNDTQGTLYLSKYSEFQGNNFLNKGEIVTYDDAELKFHQTSFINEGLFVHQQLNQSLLSPLKIDVEYLKNRGQIHLNQADFFNLVHFVNEEQGNIYSKQKFQIIGHQDKDAWICNEGNFFSDAMMLWQFFHNFSFEGRLNTNDAFSLNADSAISFNLKKDFDEQFKQECREWDLRVQNTPDATENLTLRREYNTWMSGHASFEEYVRFYYTTDLLPRVAAYFDGHKLALDPVWRNYDQLQATAFIQSLGETFYDPFKLIKAAGFSADIISGLHTPWCPPSHLINEVLKPQGGFKAKGKINITGRTVKIRGSIKSNHDIRIMSSLFPYESTYVQENVSLKEYTRYYYISHLLPNIQRYYAEHDLKLDDYWYDYDQLKTTDFAQSLGQDFYDPQLLLERAGLNLDILNKLNTPWSLPPATVNKKKLQQELEGWDFRIQNTPDATASLALRREHNAWMSEHVSFEDYVKFYYTTDLLPRVAAYFDGHKLALDPVWRNYDQLQATAFIQSLGEIFYHPSELIKAAGFSQDIIANLHTPWCPPPVTQQDQLQLQHRAWDFRIQNTPDATVNLALRREYNAWMSGHVSFEDYVKFYYTTDLLPRVAAYFDGHNLALDPVWRNYDQLQATAFIQSLGEIFYDPFKLIKAAGFSADIISGLHTPWCPPPVTQQDQLQLQHRAWDFRIQNTPDATVNLALRREYNTWMSGHASFEDYVRFYYTTDLLPRVAAYFDGHKLAL